MEVKVKKWGNSMAIILPSEEVRDKGIKENDKLEIPALIKVADLSKIFGTLKLKKGMSAQKMKDLAREGWD